MQAVPTIGLNVTAEDDETARKPAVREAMGEGRSLTIFNKGRPLADDISSTISGPCSRGDPRVSMLWIVKI